MDKVKRRALLNPGVLAQQGAQEAVAGNPSLPTTAGQPARVPRQGLGTNSVTGIDVNALVNGMTATGVRI